MRKIKAFLFITVSVCIFLFLPKDAHACILMYAGGNFTDDGGNLFIRTEEIYADSNKLYYVSPAGKRKKGEVYRGCFGFRWTFTHDSYRYTARRDDNLSGPCRNCGSTHDHTPFEEAGTNDHGVTVSATQSIDPNARIAETDPFTREGITESEITTILLSEASTAREGVEILLGIYDRSGAGEEGSGVMICDRNEQWYVENLSGHQYLAVLLPPGAAFMQFNVSVLGEIDLNDTAHVIASENLISTAQKAGTFVGNAEKNIIDFRRSYNDYTGENADEELLQLIPERLAVSLNYLNGTDRWTTENVLEDNDYIMKNIDENGNITALHNRLALKNRMSLEDVLAVFRLDPIGYGDNVNTHLYRFYPEKEETLGTVEWSTMDNTRYNVFIPCYPMLLTNTWEGYKVPLADETVTEERPDAGDFYRKEGKYHVFPAGWERSYIGTLSALSALMNYGELDREQIESAGSRLRQLQEAFIRRFAVLSEQIASEPSPDVREKIMTQADMEMASRVHDLALSIYREYSSK